MIDLTSIFNSSEINSKISFKSYDSSQKEDILNKLYTLQSYLENRITIEEFNNVHNMNSKYLKFVDELIFQVKELDRSLTEDILSNLREIVNTLKR